MSVEMYDYRGFTPKKLGEPRFRHLRYLLFWPVYWLRYPIIEAINPPLRCHEIWCPLDERIPFQEWFLIPYMLWMVSLLGFAVYALGRDVPAFRRYSRFLILAMGMSTVVFLVYPSCQNLRPEVLPRENLLSELVKLLYAADTNTNVLPSEHAIGAIGVMLAAWNARGLDRPLPRLCIGAAMVLVGVSTVFLKQHSLLDLAAAVPVSALAWVLSKPEWEK